MAKRKTAKKTSKKASNQPRRSKIASFFLQMGKGFYGVLVLCSALVVILWGIYTFTAKAPPTATPTPTPAPTLSASPQPGGEDPAPTPTPTPAPQLVRKDSTWTFLLCAQDQASGSTDTIMACTYDTVNQTIGLVSIPRDTLIVREGWKYHKLNAAYACGGMTELMDAASELLGIPIDHYVYINTRIFVELVDAVDGVDFDVPVHMAYDDEEQDLSIHYEPGLQHLTGQQALEVVRCRKNSDGPGEYPNNLYDAYPDADIGRTRTQQAIVKAIAQKVFSNPQKVGSYMELFSKYVDTDLTLGNLLWFMGPALQFNFDDLVTATLPGDGTVTYQGVTYCYALDVAGSLDIINDCLNPYTTPVTAGMVKMAQGK